MRILALDAALGRAAVAVVVDGAVVAERQAVGGRGQAAVLAPMAAAVLDAAGIAAAALDAVAVTVGPGSFTGLRAAISLAHGMAQAAGRPVVGVTVAEAMAEALPALGGRGLWVAIDSRRGRVFLDRGAGPVPTELAALPVPESRVAVAGDAAPAVAAGLAAAGHDVMLTDLRAPPIRQVALVAARRLAGLLPALDVVPLYVDAPEAKLPPGGLRPAPA
jgi:tRNA threonylcarbamoyladenosine biosynthesis protein TsaB